MAMIVTTEQDKRIAEQQIRLREQQRAQQQAAGGDKKAVKMVKGNKDSKVEIPEHEQNLVHVAVLSRTLAPDQQSFNEQKRVLVFQPRNFDERIASGTFASYADAKVIHDPRENAPKEYALKPVEPSLPSLAVVNDRELKAREAALAEREEKLKAMEERLAKLEGAQKQDGTTGEKSSDLPPLDPDASQQKTAGKGTAAKQ